jgi:hypothetical protein
MVSLTQNRRLLVSTFLLAMALCNMTMAFRMLPELRNGYQDFTIYYTGARLIRSERASLYDLATQYRTELSFTHVPIRLGPLPFNHPPFEALLFVPFTLLDFWPAYLLWTAFNLIMLTAVVTLLARHFPGFAAVSPLTIGIGSIAYFPITIGIIQGQDIILLLLLVVLAVICLEREHAEVAGALLGLGLFRPQWALPLVLLFAIRRWRVLLGFAPVAVILAGISAAIMGWRGPLNYVQFVLHLEGTDARGFSTSHVPNLRGLIQQLPGTAGPWKDVLIFAFSGILFFLAARRIRNGRDSIIFSSSLAVVTTILISFHTLVYDLSLLFPMLSYVLFRTADPSKRNLDSLMVITTALMFLTPLYVFLHYSVGKFVYVSLILLWFYLKLLLTPAPALAPA